MKFPSGYELKQLLGRICYQKRYQAKYDRMYEDIKTLNLLSQLGNLEIIWYTGSIAAYTRILEFCRNSPI